MNFININNNNIDLINKFLKNTTSKHFRYYNKRKPEDAIKNHVYTIIGVTNEENDNKYVCYGHIDKCDNKYWLGICVSDEYQNKKYGT